MTIALSGLDLSSQKIVNMADPTAAQDAATKNYVDSAAPVTSWMAPVQFVAFSNVNVATNGLAAVDLSSLTAGDRVLLANQLSVNENGVWIAATGAWTRASDMAAGSSQHGSTMLVQAGGVNARQVMVLTSGVVVGTDNLIFLPLTVAGTGLSRLLNTLSVKYGTIAGTAAQGNDSRITGALQAGTRIDQLAAPTSDVAWGAHKLTGLADPTLAQDAATKTYVDSLAASAATKSYVDATVGLSLYMPTAAKFETLPRTATGISINMVTARLYLAVIWLPLGLSVSNIVFVIGGGTGSTMSHYWYSLYDNALSQLAVTTDTLTTAVTLGELPLAIAANAAGAASSWTTTYAGYHYLGVSASFATSGPQLATISVNALLAGIAPSLGGISDTGQAGPPTFPHTAAAVTASTSGILYGYVN